MNDLIVSKTGAEVEEALPVLPLKNTVVYPDLVSVLAVGRSASLAAVQVAADGDQYLIAAAQRDPQQQNPALEDLHEIACLVRIKRVERRDDGAQVIVQGVQRIKLLNAVDSTATYLRVHYHKLPNITLDDSADDAPRVEALIRDNMALARRLAAAYDIVNGDQILEQLVATIADPISQM
ncbi:MAG: LON peptidase substrate-binding domain-containing protein, partial [Pseudomonadales bacterium]